MTNELKRVIDLNNSLGFETIVLKNSNLLAYTEGNKIYLNVDKLGDRLAKANMHEVLHHYQHTKLFELIKEKFILGLRTKDYDELKATYKLAYGSVVKTDKELEDEIVIDILAGNIQVPYIPFSKKKAIRYLLDQEPDLNLPKKFLNIQHSKKIESSFAKLSKWEKIFANNYYKNGLPNDKWKLDTVKDDVGKELKRLIKICGDKNYFMPDIHNSEQLKRHIDIQIKKAEAVGDLSFLKFVEQNYDAYAMQEASKFGRILYEQYYNLAKALQDTDYEYAFRAVILADALEKTYEFNYQNDTLNIKADNRVNGETITGIMNLTVENLRYIFNNVENYQSYKSLLLDSIILNRPKISEYATIENSECYGKGQWVKFLGKQNDPNNYLSNAQKLEALVTNTPWCTKNMAADQLTRGDFYVFVDNNGLPHVAVCMNGSEVDEVRGIEDDSSQIIEEYYSDVTESFLLNNMSLENSRQWLSDSKWQSSCLKLIKKIENNKFNAKDIPEYLDAIKYEQFRPHSPTNKHQETLLAALPNLVDAFAGYYNCKPEQVVIGDMDENNYDENAVVVIGDVHLNEPAKLSNNLKAVVGGSFSAYRNKSLTSLNNLEYVTKYLSVRHCPLEDFGNAKVLTANIELDTIRTLKVPQNTEVIKGSIDMTSCYIRHFGSIKKVEGTLKVDCSKLVSFGNIEEVEELELYASDINSLGKLNKVYNNATISACPKLIDLGSLSKVGTKLTITNCPIISLGQVSKVSEISLERLPNIVDLGKVKSVDTLEITGGDLKSLGKVEEINELKLRNANLESTGNLRSVNKLTILSNQTPIEFTNLENANYLKLKNSTIASFDKLNEAINIEAENCEMPEYKALKVLKGNLTYNSCNSTGLGSIEVINGDLKTFGGSLQNVGKLRSILGSLELSNTNDIYSLDKLSTIGNNLTLLKVPLKNLKGLEKVGGKRVISVRSPKIKNINEYEMDYDD